MFEAALALALLSDPSEELPRAGVNLYASGTLGGPIEVEVWVLPTGPSCPPERIELYRKGVTWWSPLRRVESTRSRTIYQTTRLGPRWRAGAVSWTSVRFGPVHWYGGPDAVVRVAP